MAESGGVSRPILEDPAVKEFLSLMQEHNPAGGEAFFSLLRQVTDMEAEFTEALRALQSMREQLEAAQEGPVKRTLRKVVAGLERSVATLRERLATLKQSLISGCQRAVEAFKEMGVSALSHASEFFHVGPVLEAIGREADKAAALTEKGYHAIEGAAKSYHEAGRRIRNAGRAILNRDPLEEGKAPGKVVQTAEALCGQVGRAFEGMKHHALRARANVKRLEETAHRRPSIRETMARYQRKIDKEPRHKPAPALEHDSC